MLKIASRILPTQTY